MEFDKVASRKRCYRGDKGAASDIHEDDLPLSDSELNAPVPEFEFKEEWLILSEHEKWRGALSKQENKRKAQLSESPNSTNDINNGDSDKTPPERPLGIKRAKTALAMRNHQETLLAELRNQQSRSEKIQTDAIAQREQIVANLISHMDESAAKSFNNFQKIVQESTQEMTRAIKMKMLMETDWTVMGKKFCGKVRKTMLAYFQDTLETDGESLESLSEDDNNNLDTKKPARTT